MNSKLMVLFLSFFTSVTTQAKSEDFYLAFKYKTKLGYGGRVSVSRTGSKLSVNRVKIPSEKIISSKKALSYVVANKMVHSPGGSCAAGTYAFVRKVGKSKIEKEDGCVGTKRFSRLHSAFSLIKR